MRKGWNADLILVLDTWSAAVPTMAACAIMRKRYVIRTGGDFLWESYVERTGDMVLFRDFYGTRMDKMSGKERLVSDCPEKHCAAPKRSSSAPRGRREYSRGPTDWIRRRAPCRESLRQALAGGAYRQ